MEDDEIKDKSNADLLAKGLVACQVSWLVVQSVARYYARLPLTLLKIHTMVHVFSALIMYLCWWHKPKDIERATPVSAHELRGILPEMLREHRSAKDLLHLQPSKPECFFVPRVDYLYGDATISSVTDAGLWIAPALFGAVYACIHIRASRQWGAQGRYFPTATEALLWDVANYPLFLIAGVVLCIGLAIATLQLLRRTERRGGAGRAAPRTTCSTLS